jgi:hypothetical protein
MLTDQDQCGRGRELFADRAGFEHGIDGNRRGMLPICRTICAQYWRLTWRLNAHCSARIARLDVGISSNCVRASETNVKRPAQPWLHPSDRHRVQAFRIAPDLGLMPG